MKLFFKKLVLLTLVLVLSTGRGFVQVTALTTYTGDVFGLHIDTNGSNNQGGGLGIYECHYLDESVSTVNTQGWNLTEGADAQAIVNYYSSHYTCVGHTPIVGELVDGKYFTGFVVFHVTYWGNGDLKFVGIQASYSLTPPNHAPVANSQTVTTPEDVAKAITLTGSDSDGNVLSYTVLTTPLHGTLSGTAPNLTYTPTADYNGSDSFTFKVNDGTVDSNTATVSITVGPVNDVPTANNQSLITLEDVPLDIILTGSDPEGETLTYHVLSQPSFGNLSGSGSSWTYTPNSNYHGLDSFTFKVNDGHDDSNVATISISVSSVNDAPIADSQNVSTDEDTPKDITLTGSDPDDDDITFEIVTGPTNGSLTGSGSTRTYTPNPDYTGTDSFTFKVYDGALYSTEATVMITIGGVNDDPTADDQSVTLDEDTDLDILLTGMDPEGATLIFTVLTQPAHGVLTGTGADLNYEPFDNYFGPDSFTFKVSDGTADSNIAKVSILVNSVNDAPVADDQTVTTLEDLPKNIILTGSDIDDDPLTFEIKSSPLNGTLEFVVDHWVYTPDPDFNGSDAFTFVSNDGMLDSALATVTINVTPVNDAPVADDSDFDVDEGDQYDGVVTATDPDIMIVPTMVLQVTPLMLTYILVVEPTYGSLTFNPDGSYTYIHFGNESTSDFFTFKANDGELDSNIATVSITINPVNDAPTADDQTVLTLEDTPKDIILTGSDDEGDSLTFVIQSGPLFGTLEFVIDHWVYTPNPGFNGADAFTFVSNDGMLDSELATVSIVVTDINDAPVADDSSFDVDEGGQYDGQVTATDPDFAIFPAEVLLASPLMLNYILVTEPLHGSLTFNPDGTYTYIHNGGESTSDRFTFKANDGVTDSNVAEVLITINPINDAPVANDQSVLTLEDTPKDIILTGSDIDGDSLTFVIKSSPLNGILEFVVDHWVYTPNPGFNGADAFTFVSNDGKVDSALATVTIVVTDVNDAPVADDSSFDVDEGGLYDGEVTATDPDFGILPAEILLASPLMLTYTLVVGPTNGSLTFNPDGSYTYIHNGGETTSDRFTFKANDGAMDSNIATVSITINPINDAPVATGLAFTLIQGAQYLGTLSATDPDDTLLTYALVTGPLNGTLVINTDGTFTYRHSGVGTLPDVFTFNVYDGEATSNTATVSITVTPLVPVNRAPIGFPEAFTVVEGGSIDGLVTGADADGDPIVFFLTEDVKNGTLTFAANGAYTYTHNNSETTSDSFRFRVWDGKVYSPILTATITVTPVNEAPVAVNGTDETDFETALTGNIRGLASDIDSANWTMVVVSTTTHGTLVLNADGSFTYTPNADFTGIDVFSFKANDGALDSNVANYTITVNADVIIIEPETPLSPLSFWWAYLLGLLLLLLFFLRPNLKYALVDRNGNEKVIRRHIFANGKDDLFIDLNDKNVEGLVAVDLVVYKQLVKREQGRKITFNLFKKPMKTISIPEDMKEKIEDQIKL